MTNDQLTDPAVTTTVVRWGVQTTLPDGMLDYEPRSGLPNAITTVSGINRTFPGTAAVVYRTEEYGPWTTDLDTGNEFGVQFRFSNGRTEVNPADDRAGAEARTMLVNFNSPGEETAEVVARRAAVGPWQPFTSRARTTHADVQLPPVALRRPWWWWLGGPLLWLGLLLFVAGVVLPGMVGTVVGSVGILLAASHVPWKLSRYHHRP